MSQATSNDRKATIITSSLLTRRLYIHVNTTTIIVVNTKCPRTKPKHHLLRFVVSTTCCTLSGNKTRANWKFIQQIKNKLYNKSVPNRKLTTNAQQIEEWSLSLKNNSRDRTGRKKTLQRTIHKQTHITSSWEHEMLRIKPQDFTSTVQVRVRQRARARTRFEQTRSSIQWLQWASGPTKMLAVNIGTINVCQILRNKI